MDKLFYPLLFLQLTVFLSWSGLVGASPSTTQPSPETTAATTHPAETKTSVSTTKKKNETVVNGSLVNVTSFNETNYGSDNPFNKSESSTTDNPFFHMLKSSDAVLRAVYVASGILLIILVYTFCRLRRNSKKSKWHKYGLLKNTGEVEMMPLGTEEEEEDETTMFDARTFRNDKK